MNDGRCQILLQTKDLFSKHSMNISVHKCFLLVEISYAKTYESSALSSNAGLINFSLLFVSNLFC